MVTEPVEAIERGNLRSPAVQHHREWRSTFERDWRRSRYSCYRFSAGPVLQSDETFSSLAVLTSEPPGVDQTQSLLVVLQYRRIDLLFNLKRPEYLALVRRLDEDGHFFEDTVQGAKGVTDPGAGNAGGKFCRSADVLGTLVGPLGSAPSEDGFPLLKHANFRRPSAPILYGNSNSLLE
jgi:hypothetical protein